MALQITSEFQGIELPTAYVRIEDIHMVVRPRKILSVRLSVYANKAAADAGKAMLTGMDFSFEDWAQETRVDENGDTIVTKEASTAFTRFNTALSAAKDPRASAYTFIKAERSELAGAIDIIES